MLSGSARRIVVVGSVNIDLMLRCPQVPAAGEHGEPLLLNPARRAGRLFPHRADLSAP